MGQNQPDTVFVDKISLWHSHAHGWFDNTMVEYFVATETSGLQSLKYLLSALYRKSLLTLDQIYKLLWFSGAQIYSFIQQMCSYLSWASLVAQTIKNLPAMWETWVWSSCWEDLKEKGTATHSSILAWRIPWRATVYGVTEMNTTEQLSFSHNYHYVSNTVQDAGCKNEQNRVLPSCKLQPAGEDILNTWSLKWVKHFTVTYVKQRIHVMKGTN